MNTIRTLIVLLICLLCRTTAGAQTYADTIQQYRQQYTDELLSDARAPIKKGDVRFLSFFPPDAQYRLWADFTPTPGSKPFLINTHSGKQKPYKEYGTLTFTIRDTTQVLHIYQSVDMVNGPAGTHLFIPFNDGTNYDHTFGGGRYIDLSTADITGNKYLLDFNKCYNPYCAFAEGYSCPIPPDENHLSLCIFAGEKMFTKHMGR